MRATSADGSSESRTTLTAKITVIQRNRSRGARAIVR